jgi:sterol desaturase/sphingolipid hydroxylase (fatty acid hydroxylase superfamily)
METVFSSAQLALAKIAPAALVFMALAIVMKRDKVLDALMAARREIGTNFGLFLINTAVLVPLVTVPLLAFQDALPRLPGLVDFWAAVPAVLVALAAMLVMEFAAYWRHRWEHSPELWRVHATHHADEAMNWLTLHRKHPLGELLSLIIDLIPALLLGLPVWAIMTMAVLRSWWGYFIHADVPWTLGVFGKVLISPAAHRLHHIRDETLMGSNYGNTITLWDRLFGTYIDPAPYVNCETGIAEGTRDLGGELLRPFEARYWRRSAGNAGGEAVIAPTQNTP